LNEQRLGAVVAALRGSGARRVLDLGCGEGKLVRELLKDKQFMESVGLEVSIRSLEMASRRLKLERLPTHQAERVKLIVDVTDPASEAAGVDWWTTLTAGGGEGMVVKPVSFVLRGNRGLAQPAVKCRGREYLRIIYGPEYSTAENLARLQSRGLSHKRSLALGEFALGVEGLERFVRQEPLRRVHECVFGVLALESEPVDPRL
jgi:SAM-dependent methyltransferase